MDNCWTSLKKVLCCSNDGATDGGHQGLPNPPSGPSQSPQTALTELPSPIPEGAAVGQEKPLEEVKEKPNLAIGEVSSRPTVGVHEGLQNPLSGPPKSPTALPILQDGIKYFKETVATCNIDALIQAIDQLLKYKLKQASTSTPGTSSGRTDLIPNWTSAIDGGATFLKFVNEHTEKIDAKDDFFPSGGGQQVVEEILQLLGQLHWIVGGLSVIAYLLNKVDKVSENKSECIQLLKYMFDLANHTKQLNFLLPGQEEKLRDAFVLIIEGCMTCASQLQEGKFFRFLKSSVNSLALQNLSSRIDHLYQDLTLTTVRETLTTVKEIKRDQPVVLPVRTPVYPEGAVGLEKPLEELKKKVDLQASELSPRVVVIYGFGGIGKTTLAKALVATLADDIQDHKYTKVEISEESQKNDFTKMQQQILRDCFPTSQSGKQIEKRDSEEGRDLLKDAFNSERQKPVFIYIDNVLRSNDLKELLPKDLRDLPNRSRILVTTRNLAVTDMFLDSGITRHDYKVNPLSKEHGIDILSIDPAYFDRISSHVEEIMQTAGGIPLVLKILGARLRKQKYRVENCVQILKALQDGGDVKEDNLSERLIYFVYNNDLEPSTQEAFLDICFLFNGYRRRRVEYIVGVEEVRSLVEAALVTSLPVVNSLYLDMSLAGEDKLIVHDVVQAKGRSMGESTRIKDWSRAAKCQVIKGIELDDQEIVIEESQLSRMTDSLSILSLGDGIRISARSSKTFQKLRYLKLGERSPCLPMNLEGLPCLSFYSGPMFEEVVSKLPQHLKYLGAVERSSSDVDEYASLRDSMPIQAVRNSSLEELHLSVMEGMSVMLDGRFDFDALKILSLMRWTEMEELPPQVCGLLSLKKLILRQCRRLKRVPESIANLTALKHLDLSECECLEEVCSSLGKLKALQSLDLSYCFALRKLPDNFGQLLALEVLDLSCCEKLKALPGNFAQLKSLKQLDLTDCEGLEELPSNFAQLPSLEVLRGYDRVGKLLEGLGFRKKNDNWRLLEL